MANLSYKRKKTFLIKAEPVVNCSLIKAELDVVIIEITK